MDEWLVENLTPIRYKKRKKHRSDEISQSSMELA